MLCNFKITFFFTFSTILQPFSVKFNFESLFTHLLVGVDYEYIYIVIPCGGGWASHYYVRSISLLLHNVASSHFEAILYDFWYKPDGYIWGYFSYNTVYMYAIFDTGLLAKILFLARCHTWKMYRVVWCKRSLTTKEAIILEWFPSETLAAREPVDNNSQNVILFCLFLQNNVLLKKHTLSIKYILFLVEKPFKILPGDWKF